MSPRDGVNGAFCFATGPALTFCSRRAAEIERRSASGGSKAASGAGASDNADYIRTVISSSSPAFGLVQISRDLLGIGFLPDRPVRPALLAWRISGKLADGRPLQRRPVAAAVAAYRGHHPGLRRAHGAM